MNIINVGDPRTISLLAGQTISVTTMGTITATCVSGLGLIAGATIGSTNGSTVFGSYSVDGSIKLTATNRDGAYELNTDTSEAIKSVTGSAGQDVLDAGSKSTVENSGIDTGHISPGDKYTFPGIDTSALSTYPQYIANIDAFCLGKSSITKTDLGVVSNGVDHMYEYMAGSGPVNVLINCGSHGDEVQASFAAYVWFKEFCTSNSTLFSSLRKRITVSWIPMANPSKFRTGRTNANGAGVDLNRNNNFYWSRYVPVDPVLNAKGASADSEVETVLRKSVIDNRNCVAVIDCHNYWASFSSNDIMPTPPSSFVLHNESQYRAANAAWLKAYGGTLGTAFVDAQGSNPELVNWSAFYNTVTRGIPYADSVLLECKMEIAGSTATNLTSAGATLYGGYITTWLLTYLSSMYSMRPQPNHAWGMRRVTDAVGTSISAGGTLLDGGNLVFSPLVFDEAKPGVGGLPRTYMDCPVLCPGTIEVYADGYIESAGAAQRVDFDFQIDGVVTGSEGYCSFTVPGTAGQRVAFSLSHKFSVALANVNANYVPRIELVAARAGATQTPNIKRARMWARFVPGFSQLEVPAF